MIKINGVGQGYYDTNVNTIEALCQKLDYDFYPIGKRTTYRSLKKQESNDRWQRIKRGYPTGFYYPLTIQK